MNRRSALEWLLFATLVMCWGSSYALTKTAVAGLPPVWVVSLRLLLAAAILLTVLFARGERLPWGLRSWGWFAWIGTFGAAAPFLLISWGTQHIDSSLAAILVSGVPLLVGILAHFLLPDEPINRAAALGLTLGFAGVIIVIGPQHLFGLGGDAIELLAQFALLGAAACFATQTVTARLLPLSSAYVRATGTVVWAAIVCLVIALLADPGGLAGATPAAYAATVGLGVFPTSLAVIVLFMLLDRAGARFLSFSNYLVPVVAVALGAAFLGEVLPWNAFAGLAFILLGIALGERGRAVLASKPVRAPGE